MENIEKKKFIETLVYNISVFKPLYTIYSIKDGERRNFVLEDIYKKMTICLKNPDIIKKVQDILVHYNKYNTTKINSRMLLTAYMIASLPEYTLSIKRSEIKNLNGYERLTFDAAENIVNIIDIIKPDTNISVLEEGIQKYVEYFKVFLNLDKVRSITELIGHWCDTEETIREVTESERYSSYQKENTIETVKSIQTKIEQYIKTFDKNFDIAKLPLYFEMRSKIEKSMKLIFFDKLGEDIKNNKFDQLHKLIREISEQLLLLQSNSPRIQNDFKEKFDIELIEQMISTGIFGPNEFMAYANYLMNCIMELAAPIKVPNIKQTWIMMVAKISSGTICYFDKVVPYIFKYIFEQITDIKNDIIACNTMKNMGINVFML